MKTKDDKNQGVSRRSFLKNTMQGSAAVFGSGMLLESKLIDAVLDPPSGKFDLNPVRPNIIIFVTDEERVNARYLPGLNLPNRQRIQQHSIEFNNCYCTYPLCSPSRATLLTGLYPHQAGVWENIDPLFPYESEDPEGTRRELPLDPGIPNLASAFSSFGYDVSYFGKWHLSNHPEDPPQDTAIDLTPYGFPANDGEVLNQWVPEDEDDGLLYDPVTVQHARDWIMSKQDSQTPWLCIVSIINPHDLHKAHVSDGYDLPSIPWKPDLELPPNFEDDAASEDKPEYQRIWAEVVSGHANFPKDPYRIYKWMERINFYSYLIEKADEQLGQVLDAVENSGQWNDTIFVYTSDHGDQCAAHNTLYKPNVYDEAARVPLIISQARRYDGHIVKDYPIVSNIDIIPTLLDMCKDPDMQWPTTLPGESLKDADTKTYKEFRNVACYYMNLPRYDETPPRSLEELTMVQRTQRYKIVQYPNGEKQTFNMINDPAEMNDLT